MGKAEPPRGEGDLPGGRGVPEKKKGKKERMGGEKWSRERERGRGKKKKKGKKRKEEREIFFDFDVG
jgi:hypothetical protein